MMDPRYHSYASIPGVLGGKPTAAKLMRDSSAFSNRAPALPTILGCLFVPWLLSTLTFWMRSFDIRRDDDMLANGFCYCLLLPVAAFAWMTSNLAGRGDPKPMGFLTVTSLVGWIVAFLAGGSNYTSFMRPYYDVNSLNVYPSVDPSKYTGSQLMDAGMVHFTPGSALRLDHSIGFKNEDVYCVVPITAGPNSSQSTYDFWAVGTNCCSAHMPDYRCGEYTNPLANWGLRLMDDSKKDMFRLAVQQAEASFNLNAPHPIFFYWLSDPTSEVNAYQDDGFKYFMMFVCGAFSVQLFLVLCCLATLASC